MPVIGLGTKRPAADGPFGMLRECHERIRRFSSLSLRLATAPPQTTPDERAGAAADLLRYFTVALPLHEKDEEESLGLRLRERVLAPTGASALEALAPEHRALQATLGRLVPAWEAIRRDPAAPSPETLAYAEQLVRLFDAHLAREENDLFPAAVAVLPPSELEAITAEMQARRH